MCCVVSNNNSRGRKSFFLLWKKSLSQKQSKQTTTTKKSPCWVSVTRIWTHTRWTLLCMDWAWRRNANLKGLGSSSKAVNPGRKGQPAYKATERGEIGSSGWGFEFLLSRGSLQDSGFSFQQGCWERVRGARGREEGGGIKCVKAQREGAGPWSWAVRRGRVGFGRS